MTIWIQITAGLGPDECCLVVAKVAKLISAEAKLMKSELQLLEAIEGKRPGTFQSLIFTFDSDTMPSWLDAWTGTIKWTSQSPYRPSYPRKNWFVGVQHLHPAKAVNFSLSDVRFDTCRASGPGGQHVNKTESAVRATHLPTGLVAISQDERSQKGNRSLAIERLKRKLQLADENQSANVRKQLNEQHTNLERGNATKTFSSSLTE